MNGFHLVLGLVVVLLNGTGGVVALVRQGEADEVPSIASLGHVALVIQLASGFFLFTATTQGPGIGHYVLPAVALAAIVAARALDGDRRIRAVGAASLLAAAISVFAFVTGVLSG